MQITAVMLCWEPVRSSTTLVRRSCSLKPIFTGGKSLFCMFTDHRAYQQLQNAASQPNNFFLKKKKAIFSEKWKFLVEMENLSKSWDKINSYIRDEMLHHCLLRMTISSLQSLGRASEKQSQFPSRLKSSQASPQPAAALLRSPWLACNSTTRQHQQGFVAQNSQKIQCLGVGLEVALPEHLAQEQAQQSCRCCLLTTVCFSTNTKPREAMLLWMPCNPESWDTPKLLLKTV